MPSPCRSFAVAVGTAAVLATLSVANCAPAQGASTYPPAAARPPVEPSRVAGLMDLYVPGAGDFTLVMAAKETGPLRDVSRTIRRHGDWVRIDTADGTLAGTQYVHLPSGTMVERGEDPARPMRYLSIRTVTFGDAPRIDYRSFATGRRRTIAGEACEEWDVYRGVENGQPTFHRFGCVTADGVELSRWTVSQSGTELGFAATAVSLSRARVDPAEVEPAEVRSGVRSFDLSPVLGELAKDPTSAGAAGRDDEVVLATADGRQTRTLRAHGDWRRQESLRADGTRDVMGQLDRAGFHFTLTVSADGQPRQLAVQRWPGRPPPPPNPPTKTAPETVLGERCEWFDAMPGAFDAGTTECRTAGGLVLKRVETSWGNGTEFVAVSVRRKPQPLAAMLPPAEFLKLDRWLGR